MQISEIIHLNDWINNNWNSSNIEKYYQELISKLQGNISLINSPQQKRGMVLQSYTTELELVLDAIRYIDDSVLNVSQLQLIKTLGITERIGQSGYKNLKEKSLNSNDLVAFHQYCSESFTTLKKAKDEVYQCAQKIGLLFKNSTSLKYDFDPTKEVMLKVHFQGNSSLDDIEKFNAWGKQWQFIIDHTGYPFKTKSQDVKIVGASKGSVILELIMSAGPYAAAFGGLVSWSLSTINSVLEIKKQCIEIESLELDEAHKKQLLDTLNSAEKDRKDKAISERLELIKESLEEIDPESETKLKSAIKKLLNFIEGGGEVELIAHNDEEDGEEPTEDIKQLQQIITETRKEGQKLKALEHIRVKTKPQFEDD